VGFFALSSDQACEKALNRLADRLIPTIFQLHASTPDAIEETLSALDDLVAPARSPMLAARTFQAGHLMTSLAVAELTVPRYVAQQPMDSLANREYESTHPLGSTKMVSRIVGALFVGPPHRQDSGEAYPCPEDQPARLMRLRRSFVRGGRASSSRSSRRSMRSPRTWKSVTRSRSIVSVKTSPVASLIIGARNERNYRKSSEPHWAGPNRPDQLSPR